MRLQGRVALITGSDRGIGHAVALRFASEGADIVINFHRNEAAARATAKAIQALGRRVSVVQADVGTVADAERLVDEGWRQLGKIDVLVNNAGVEKAQPFTDVSEADYDRVLTTNLKGTYFMTQAVVKRLLAAKMKGKIINMSSVHEELPFPGYATYCASKGGVRMLTRDLAVELGRQGITVNAVAPGAIRTEINQALLDDPKRLEPLVGQIPLGRLGTPEDVAGVAAFLASGDADYVTGSTYFVDGGLTWNYSE